MRNRSAQLTLTLVCVILGTLLMLQFRAQGRASKAQIGEAGTNQAQIISNLYDSNLDLRREADKLVAQEEDYQRSVGQSDLADMVSDLGKLRVYTGLSPVTGPGVELLVDASLKPEHVLDLVNELRNAGAEAIAVNGVRVVASTPISSYRGQAVVGGMLVEPPFVFAAVGQPDTLDRALGRKGGMISYLKNTYPGVAITLKKETSQNLPVYGGTYAMRYATPAE